MKIATIVPKSHLHLIDDDPYQMVLAHIAKRDATYSEFFRNPFRLREDMPFRILDNGAAELGEGLTAHELREIALVIQPDEVVIPDVVGDGMQTRMASMIAEEAGLFDGRWRKMGVPQGRTREEYSRSMTYFLTHPRIDTIGISRFAVNDALWFGRAWLLQDHPELRASGKAIHLLGCPADPNEMHQIEGMFPGRVRGVDSGIAAIYAQEGLRIDRAAKPNVELDFLNDEKTPSTDLLMANMVGWKNRLRTGKWW